MCNSEKETGNEGAANDGRIAYGSKQMKIRTDFFRAEYCCPIDLVFGFGIFWHYSRGFGIIIQSRWLFRFIIYKHHFCIKVNWGVSDV
jgi:hypothetical protein